MEVKFSIICNICKQPVTEKTLLEHIRKHPPSDMFTLYPIYGWEESLKEVK